MAPRERKLALKDYELADAELCRLIQCWEQLHKITDLLHLLRARHPEYEVTLKESGRLVCRVIGDINRRNADRRKWLAKKVPKPEAA
jgi:hypothetical protein